MLKVLFAYSVIKAVNLWSDTNTGAAIAGRIVDKFMINRKMVKYWAASAWNTSKVCSLWHFRNFSLWTVSSIYAG